MCGVEGGGAVGWQGFLAGSSKESCYDLVDHHINFLLLYRFHSCCWDQCSFRPPLLCTFVSTHSTYHLGAAILVIVVH